VKLLLSATTIAALTAGGTAIAADLSTSTPIIRPVFAWSGFYLGANVGAGWASNDFVQTLSVGNLIEQSAITSSGVIGGGQFGWNYLPAANWLLGVEADASGATLDGSAQTTPGSGSRSPGIVGWTENVNAFGTVRGRIGYVANNWLFYGTGGFAWSYDQFTRTQLVAGTASPQVGLVMSNWPARTGLTAGGGIEWGFGRNWTARMEFLHLDLGNQSFSSLIPLGPRGGAGANTFVINEGRLTLDTVRVGLNYQFK
jgi:opacity protein-like surface antigen